ncbi:MAG: TGS domain-containing protein, partial [Clostridia bacterium]
MPHQRGCALAESASGGSVREPAPDQRRLERDTTPSSGVCFRPAPSWVEPRATRSSLRWGGRFLLFLKEEPLMQLIMKGEARTFQDGMNALDIAGEISNSLKKEALCAKLDGKVISLVEPIEGDHELEILT